jgi:hypothetical protein
MSSVVQAAKRLLSLPAGESDDLRIHSFPDDEQAHDDDLQQQIADEFIRDFQTALVDLRQVYGDPETAGDEDEEIAELIPLCGIFRYAMWTVKRRRLFLAAAHEDRELPFLLMLGTTPLE